MPREIKILSFSFLLIFLGFNGVQQFLTTFFSEAKIAEVGFFSLILIYLSFFLSSSFSAIFVSKYGPKKSMILASLFYAFFILSLLTKSTVLIYAASCLLGVAASFLWTGQNSYLVRASGKNSYGAASGFFNSSLSLGSGLGVLILGFVITVLAFKISFLIFSAFPLLGLLLLFKLKDIKTEKKIDHLNLLKKAFLSKTALRLSSIGFAASFIFGLTIGIIPIEIKNNLGMSYVGILTSLFYFLPIFLSYLFGKLSDIKGRKKMIIFSFILVLAGLISMLFSSLTVFLIAGVVLIALAWTILNPMTKALVGDISAGNNLEFLAALFLFIQNAGAVSALFLSQLFKDDTKIIYLISLELF